MELPLAGFRASIHGRPMPGEVLRPGAPDSHALEHACRGLGIPGEVGTGVHVMQIGIL